MITEKTLKTLAWLQALPRRFEDLAQRVQKLEAFAQLHGPTGGCLTCKHFDAAGGCAQKPCPPCFNSCTGWEKK